MKMKLSTTVRLLPCDLNNGHMFKSLIKFLCLCGVRLCISTLSKPYLVVASYIGLPFFLLIKVSKWIHVLITAVAAETFIIYTFYLILIYIHVLSRNRKF